jgi:hypothetical protein
LNRGSFVVLCEENRFFEKKMDDNKKGILESQNALF